MNEIIQHNVAKGIPLPDQSVNMCVTSPPYYGLRDYGNTDQLGLEKTPDEYIANMVKVFMEVHRVLKDNGTLWLNIGDSYNGAKKGNTEINKNKSRVTDSFEKKLWSGAKPKDLIGIPWMLAFALRSAGWYLRQDIIWHKPNPMPESVTDRCTKAHEYIFLFSKSPKYYFDHNAIKTQALTNENRPGGAVRNRLYNYNSKENNNPEAYRKSGNTARKDSTERGTPEGTGSNVAGSVPWEGNTANKRSVWTVTTKPFKDAHFATFPEDLITDCIKAGCPEGGIVLDPFGGAGTTAIIAGKLNRNWILYELNPAYIKIAEKRIMKTFDIDTYEMLYGL